ncbi:unnamed protein product [Effrenium voratum]|uniref:Uncharacterized protein n=1 Tax=Effrenium voratum TaxID=2562239 RepID=A0AA36IG26_9DINO|nr:unnamed protein product [Effrenium voratum]
MEESAMEDLIVARCAEALSQTQCLISQEGGKPCCWRQEGFQTNYCAPEGSAEITASKVPEACARVTKGVFRLVQDGTVGQGSLPTCTPTCVNTFAQIPNVVHENCDNCRPDEECHCTVSCAPGLKPLGGNTGPRSCLLRSNRAEFEAAPECVRPCETPDHQRGTLDVSRCMQNCAPGDRECTCDVRCASGNFRVGGGHEGLKACEATSSGPRHRKLPICLPKCAAPDDQFGALNTNKCASCIAKTECNCELSCYTRASASGAKPGRKTCSFIVGTETSAAAAVWEPSDGVGPAGVPQCLPPMVIQVQDARTQLPLRGVTITVSVPYGNSDRLHELEKLYTDRSTAKDFSVEFSSEARDLFVKIEKPGYTSVTRKLDRGKNCKDAFNCRFQFSISESLKGGQLYADGCFLIGNPKTIKWDMRAVLEWEEKPGDLDIWARNYECYASVEKSYVCDGNRPHQYDSSYGIARRRTICKRTLFTQKQVRNKEYEVCGNSLCKEDKEHRTEFSRRRVVRPECPYVATNQYPKWVHWATRYAAELSKRWRREKMIEEDYVPSYRWKKKVWAKDAYEWTAEHHMVLDVDKRTGFGPETITFQSVPVGTYQVVVNQFSSTGAQVEDISAANPRVNIYIGGNSVRFECMISETCRRKARIWNVVNIEVEDAGEVPGSTKGERKYRISIKDSQSDMIPLRWVDLPTSDKTGRDLYNMDYYFPSKVLMRCFSVKGDTNKRRR